jgi:hypothetical protein
MELSDSLQGFGARVTPGESKESHHRLARRLGIERLEGHCCIKRLRNHGAVDFPAFITESWTEGRVPVPPPGSASRELRGASAGPRPARPRQWRGYSASRAVRQGRRTGLRRRPRPRQPVRQGRADHPRHADRRRLRRQGARRHDGHPRPARSASNWLIPEPQVSCKGWSSRLSQPLPLPIRRRSAASGSGGPVWMPETLLLSLTWRFLRARAE